MIDLHSHLIPAVDDGAANLDESRTALERMYAQGVRTLVTTPHLNASLTAHPERLSAELARLDRGWEELRTLAAESFPGMRVERGVELLLDDPHPVLDDPRLRLAGTRSVLVEFSFTGVPPGSERVLFEIRMAALRPIVAHPERYPNPQASLAVADLWVRSGAALQVNWGSLAGRYGELPRRIAWDLLEQGMVSYLSSDHHARGSLSAEEGRALLLARGGEEQLELLTATNPQRLLDNQPPLDVPPLQMAKKSFWGRLMGR
ncbi:tyrosine-protein phosphatase [Longimicrobium terrae]|uniref:protein-tyrosine-phosphatase n=1 Tax=Longimicrobium terrae TaxID=1639882 RepID=A0A841GV69_9BACT|nr:CpsB/CapC family capsule biosynthesis tyrosine phosphatase [Longimicrobium terrae]MBB4634525.1 protein-tyrosine phosphatase [Longimicrobium terrae]MBB6068585.1 protein-tyrosine phosphatase [Longimicrobium terrae]NNC27772.1 hypothetical protein [Longimicrobium terrae]